MLVVSNLSKKFRPFDDPIFQEVSFAVNAGERIGLVGPNGCGKTTLLKIIMGELPAVSGSVHFNPPGLRMGYLAQGLVVADNLTIQDVLFPQLVALQQAEADVEHLSVAMSAADNGQLESLMQSYGIALEQLEMLNRRIDIARGEQLLAEFDLGGYALDTLVAALSGGQKTRLGLAALLVDNPQLLILDEPTNHLDVTALEWLENWLQNFKGGALIVSHDRTFLDRVVNRIVAIDKGTARVFEGSYRDYVATVRSELDKQWAQWRDQQVEIARLQADASRTMARAVRKENATIDSTQRRYAKKVAKRAKAKETRLKRYLESEDRVGKPRQTWNLKLDFADLPTTGQDVVFLEDLAIGYAPDMPLLEKLNLTLRAGERVVVLGPNGHGKSTLLKTIIGQIPALDGRVRIGASVKVGYLAQEQDSLDPAMNALQTLLTEVGWSETEARSFLHFFLFAGDDVFRPAADLSFGERARLMLAVLVARGANLLILDEPINHLDVPSREQFEQALSAFPGSILAVVHDRYFVDKFATIIWHIEHGKLIHQVHKSFLTG